MISVCLLVCTHHSDQYSQRDMTTEGVEVKGAKDDALGKRVKNMNGGHIASVELIRAGHLKQ